MKKRFLLISLLLVACGNNKTPNVSLSQNMSSNESSITSSSNSETFESNESEVEESDSLEEEISSKDIESESSIDEENSSNEFEEDTPKSRHDYYLDYSKLDKWYAIAIQGKLIGFEQYPYSPTCNAWFQEEKYGYYVINLPLEFAEIGKSYQVYGNAFARSYYGINAKSDYFYCLECDDIQIEEINLNEETPSNDDYIGSRVNFDGVIESINDNVMSVNINNMLYNISYNKDVISSSEITPVWSNYSVGDTFKGKGILHSTNREIKMIDVSDFNLTK